MLFIIRVNRLWHQHCFREGLRFLLLRLNISFVMKRLLFSAALIFVSVSANAGTISSVSQSSTNLQFDFSLADNFLSPGFDTATFVSGAFPGGTLEFKFQDRIISLFPFQTGDQETFTTPGGTLTYNVDFGPLNFAGSYLSGGSTVNWTIDSTVTTRLGNDTWIGTFRGTARATTVPDSGTTAGLMALALVGLAAIRRKLV